MSEQIGLGEEICGNCINWRLGFERLADLITGDCLEFKRKTQNHQTCATEIGRLALSDPQSMNFQGAITKSRFSPYAPERTLGEGISAKGEDEN